MKKKHFIESPSFQDESFNKEFMKLLHNHWCDLDIVKNEQLSFQECEFSNESENWTKSTCSYPAGLRGTPLRKVDFFEEKSKLSFLRERCTEASSFRIYIAF